MPTSPDLVAAIGAVLRRAGATYASRGTRDKHYGVWIFSVVLDEGRKSRGAILQGVRKGDEAVFRGKPGDLDSRTTYTHARLGGARRDWESHVDVNILGASGASHGVDISVMPANTADEARRDGRQPRLGTAGLGIEAKCFSVPLTPNEGRVVLGFQAETQSLFWLVANKTNSTVETMLGSPGRKTDFFGDATPTSLSEDRLRRAIAAQLDR